MAAWILKRRLWVAVGMLLIGYVMFLFFLGPYKLSAYKAAMLKRGEMTDLSRFVSNHPLNTENAAKQLDAITFALGFPTNYPNVYAPMKLISPGVARVSWKMKDIFSENGIQYAWSDIQKQWEVRRNKIDQLTPILELPHLDRYLDYQKGFSLQLPHLGKNKSTIYWFQIAISTELRQGNLDNALRYALNLLQFIRLQSEEPLVISQIVNCAYFNMAFASLWEILQAEGWKNNQLSRIQMELERLDFLAPMKQALAVQRAFGPIEYFHLRNFQSYYEQQITLATTMNMGNALGNVGTSAGVSSFFGDILNYFSVIGGWMKDTGVRTANTMRYLRWKHFISYDDEVSFFERHNFAIGQMANIITGKPIGEVYYDLDQWGIRCFKERKSLLAPQMTGNLTMVFEKIAFTETMRQICITALAVKRYEIQNHHLPQTLAPLVPAFVTSLPRDPLDGKSIRYAVSDSGIPRIYSTGRNMVDDGGSANPSEERNEYSWLQDGKDWVWPKPNNDTIKDDQ